MLQDAVEFKTTILIDILVPLFIIGLIIFIIKYNKNIGNSLYKSTLYIRLVT
jgi:hypothetical protein